MPSIPPAVTGTLLPDYAGGSLVNLMRTIEDCLHAAAPAFRHPPLSGTAGLSAGDLEEIEHLLLVVIDGLGERQLARHAPDGWLSHHLRGTLTSVFPSTTASAIPTFLSGLAPRQHGLIGWHMRDEVSGQIVATLPLELRDEHASPLPPAMLASRLLSYAPLAARLPGSCCHVTPAEIAGSPFNKAHAPAGPTCAYRDLAGFAAALSAACEHHRLARRRRREQPGFTYAYCPYPDALMHQHGTGDPRVGQSIRALDRLIGELCGREGDGLAVIVTADHGFIDAPPARLIEIEAAGAHARWLDFLQGPLWGERRIAFAAVAADRQAEFRGFVADRYGECLMVLSAADFLSGPWLGPGPAHAALASRVGDFVLLMKEDWTIKDWLAGERHHRHLAVHGGASPDEMRVPLAFWRG